MKFKELAKTIWKRLAGPASEPAPATVTENITPPVGDMAVIADTPPVEIVQSPRAAQYGAHITIRGRCFKCGKRVPEEFGRAHYEYHRRGDKPRRNRSRSPETAENLRLSRAWRRQRRARE